MQQGIVIALMGPQGAGKTTFLNSLSARACSQVPLGDSVTTVGGTRVSLQGRGDVTLVEIPSLDDSSAIVTLSRFLVTYRQSSFVGAIYFHRIKDTRERKKDFKLFSQVLTAIPAENTALITAMPYTDEVRNIEREQELAALWNEATTRGASIGRFSNNSESAWSIIAQLVVPERLEPSPIREENLFQFLYMMLAKNEEEAGLLKGLRKIAKTDKDEDLKTVWSAGALSPSLPSQPLHRTYPEFHLA
ncbi:hypothetical protein PC9H_002735 [Pleurotus ostreatus]|uniref:G domain-containing protein n=1 Tax=Pleurotus ostreatus TaxID=5322 RepID=A0A8H6ZKB8_PLEOS|nr:uncharacterized protein PC9H_002735 [Pleurotus ostreatus]KAF7416469.1 hypothetical protein PC9H_002735 [Pleurotus ostreatus]